MDITPTSPLARFRAELYQSGLGRRRDALCELLDAVLSGDGPPAWPGSACVQRFAAAGPVPPMR